MSVFRLHFIRFYVRRCWGSAIVSACDDADDDDDDDDEEEEEKEDDHKIYMPLL